MGPGGPRGGPPMSGPGGLPGWGPPQGQGGPPMLGPGGPPGWGPPQGPGGPPMLGPCGFFGSFCDLIGSCLSFFCCCWLMQDCFGGPMGPPGPPRPYGPPPL